VAVNNAPTVGKRTDGRENVAASVAARTEPRAAFAMGNVRRAA
jgi:hypothetical protein